MDSGYQQARDGAAFGRRLDRGRLVLTGADAVPFLHALLTNDIASLEPGMGCYAVLLTPQGRMITDMEVIRTEWRGEPAVLLAVPSDVAAPLAARLDASLFTEDVTVEDVSDATVQFGLAGPRAGAALDAALAALGGDPAAAALTHPYQSAAPAGGVVAWRGDQLGAVDSFELVVDAAAAAGVGAALARQAAPLSPQARDVLRVEAGRPAFHTDMTGETIPLEANLLDRAISTTKGCYVGQEIIVRILHRGGGRVAKRLVPLRFEGAAGPGGVPAPQTALMDGEREIGRVTSAVLSPRDNAAIGLGYVHRDLAREGAVLALAGGGTARVIAV